MKGSILLLRLLLRLLSRLLLNLKRRQQGFLPYLLVIQGMRFPNPLLCGQHKRLYMLDFLLPQDRNQKLNLSDFLPLRKVILLAFNLPFHRFHLW